MNIWRKFEFRGRDINENPFVDFGFVVIGAGRWGLTSHMLREALWVDAEDDVIPAFKRYYEGQGFSKLRCKVLWDNGGPLDTPSEVGWQNM
jgi:hypothetical protein